MMLELINWVPAEAAYRLQKLLMKYPTDLKVVRPRKTKLGDYRLPPSGQRHRITINAMEDKEEFLFTLLHELAHLYAFQEYGRKIQPHGREWKLQYRFFLLEFMDVLGEHPRFHLEVTKLPARMNLTESLSPDDSQLRVHHLNPGDIFIFNDKRKMKMLRKLRKYYVCVDLINEKKYRVHPMGTVTRVLGK